MPNLRGTLFTILIAAFFILSAGQPVAGQGTSSLTASVQAQGAIHVIVGLNVGFSPEGLLGSQSAQNQRVEIQQAQDDVITSLSSTNSSDIVTLDSIPYLIMTVDQAGLEALQNSPLVNSIVEDRRMELFLDESAKVIGANMAWDAGYDGSGQTVAILDTGVDRTHWFFGGRVVNEACFSVDGTVEGQQVHTVCPNGEEEQTGPGSGINCPLEIDGCYHGTHVAGIAAGHGVDFSGVARNANIIAVQVTSSAQCPTLLGGTVTCPVPLFSSVTRGLDYIYGLRNTYQIASVNLSIGTNQEYMGICDSEDEFASMKAAIDNLQSAGIAVIAASGNGGFSTGISAPACLSNTVSVGASSTDFFSTDKLPSFTNSSAQLDLLAPGLNIMSSTPDGEFQNANGTSMAAPQVTGAWAVLREANSGASISTILSALKNTGVPVTDSRNLIVTPRIQLDAALASLAGATFPAPSNDSFANRQAVNLGFRGSVLNTRATTEGGLNLPGLPANCPAIAKDVWFAYTAPDARSVTFFTEGSNFDTSLAVWTNVPGSPSLASCHDDVSVTELQSRVTVTTTPGTTYYIQAGGKNGASGVLRFAVQENINHDEIASARTISSLSFSDAYNTEQTAKTDDDPLPQDCSDYLLNDPTPWHTVWYHYVPTHNQTVVFDTFVSNFNTLLAIWRGSPGSLTQIACHDDIVSDPFGAGPVSNWVSAAIVELEAGQSYYIMAGGKDAFFTNLPKGELKFSANEVLIHPPINAPTLTAPTGGAQINFGQLTLQWSAVSGATAYELQVGTTNPPATDMIHVTGTSYTPTVALPANQPLYWRVRAVSGTPTSAWSSTRTFTMLDSIEPPVQVAPLDGATVNANELTFEWNAASGATSYELQIGTTNPPTTNVIPVTGTSYTPTEALPTDEQLFWRIRSVRGAQKSEWSDALSFALIATTPGDPPIRNFFTTDTPTLVWSPVTWGIFYHVQVADNPEFTNPLYDEDTLTTSSVMLPSLDRVKTYYWHVRAQNDKGAWGLWSEPEEFAISP